MRKITLLLLLIAFLFNNAEAQLTSLNENFNTSCPTGDHGPTGWTVYNVTPSTDPDADKWTCDPSYGRSGTPGISCSGYYGSPTTNHTDTSFLISPELDISGYSGNIYLNYDTKATKITLGAKLDIIVANNSSLHDSVGSGDTAYLASSSPIFGQPDSTDWVTHQANLAGYKTFVHLYIGFRYASAANTATASRWFLDNINTTTIPLAVNAVPAPGPSFSIIGMPSTDEISVLCNTKASGLYDVTVYDMIGRQAYKEQMQMPMGKTSFTLRGLHLDEGMYILKMGNETGYSVAKVLIR